MPFQATHRNPHTPLNREYVRPWVPMGTSRVHQPPLGSPLLGYVRHMGRTHALGYGDGSVYPEKVKMASGRSKEVWKAEIVIDGKRIRRTRSTQRAATEVLDELRAMSAAGLPVGDDTRLGEYLDWYTDKVLSQKHPNTAACYVWAFQQLGSLRGKRLRQLTPDHLEVLLEQLANRSPGAAAKKGRGGRSKPLGRTSLARIRSCLGTALKKAEARGLVSRNIALLAELPANAALPVPKRALSQEEAKRLLDSLVGSRWEALVLVAMTLGLRPGEVLGLPWKAVNLNGGTLEIRQALQRIKGQDLVIGPPKSGSHRTIRLPGNVVNALKTHRLNQKKERLQSPAWDDHGLVFPSHMGTPMDSSNLRRVVGECCRKAGVTDITPNEFRHSAATLLSEAQIPIQDVADLLGHKDTRMLAKYYRHRRGVVDLTEGQGRMFGGG